MFSFDTGFSAYSEATVLLLTTSADACDFFGGPKESPGQRDAN